MYILPQLQKKKKELLGNFILSRSIASSCLLEMAATVQMTGNDHERKWI